MMSARKSAGLRSRVAGRSSHVASLKAVLDMSQRNKKCEAAPTICAARKGGTPVGRIPAKVGSFWSLRAWERRLEISGQAEFFPGPCFF